MSTGRTRRAWLLGIALALLAACSGSAPGGVRRFRYAEAVEVPAPVEERDRLAALIAGFAYRNGLYFHDTSPRGERTSNGRQTLAFAIDRKLTNGRPWAEIKVSAIGNGPALITFVTPLDPGAAPDSERGRAQLLAELRRQWPATAQVPILPDGGIPLEQDLRPTPEGLKIVPAKAAQYHLPGNSPLLAD